jgi:hypothetical protein
LTTLAVSFGFVTPLGLLFALASAIPIVAFLATSRRARRARTALGLDPYGGVHPVWTAATIAAVVVLLATALAQPVVRTRSTQRVREDAEVFYVFDISRSMLAADSPSALSRMERAQRIGLRMRRRLSDLPSGVASLTDRVLPHLFPTADEEVFTATVESVGVDKPASRAVDDVTTLFAAFDTMAGDNFFGVGVPNRVVVLVTDGESAPYDTAALRQALAKGPPTKFVVIVTGEGSERVWYRGGGTVRGGDRSGGLHGGPVGRRRARGESRLRRWPARLGRHPARDHAARSLVRSGVARPPGLSRVATKRRLKWRLASAASSSTPRAPSATSRTCGASTTSSPTALATRHSTRRPHDVASRGSGARQVHRDAGHRA